MGVTHLLPIHIITGSRKRFTSRHALSHLRRKVHSIHSKVATFPCIITTSFTGLSLMHEQNEKGMVEALLKRLGADGDAVFSVEAVNGGTGEGRLLQHLHWPCTLRTAFLVRLATFWHTEPVYVESKEILVTQRCVRTPGSCSSFSALDVSLTW